MNCSLDVAIFGAGISGICAAIKLKTHLGIDSFVIFEENHEVGGTWLVNTYPGLACDVPSHLYSYSFEPNPNWSKLYAGQEEILQYLQNVAKKYDLYSRIKFQHKVVSAEWDEHTLKWQIKVLNNHGLTENYTFNIILSAIGGLRTPNLPKKFHRFIKPKIHSAQWDSKIDINNKVVALVGSGASAVQIIPSIVDKVKNLIVYQRHPPWVIPKMQIEFPNVAKWVFANIPGAMLILRNLIFWGCEFYHSAFKRDTMMNWLSTKMATFHLNRHVKDIKIRRKLLPDYVFGCRRITPSNDYYAAITKPNVTIINSEISKITQDSITTQDGRCATPDVLILATGFNVQDFFAPMVVKAKGGEDLLKKWKLSGPCAYCGVVCHYTPNAFFIVGPNTGLGHNSLIFSIECQVNWTMKIIAEMMKRKAKTVTIKQSEEMTYMNEIMNAMNSTVWVAPGCSSWYSDSRGTVTALWPKNLWSYYKLMKNVDFSKFEFE